MNVYRLMGSRIGTAAALDLGDRLSRWHDAMVVHARRFGTNPAAECDDDCPHAEARGLWLAAVDVFGDLAFDLKFLVKHGARALVSAPGQLDARP
jgi:hypothetical protein